MKWGFTRSFRRKPNATAKVKFEVIFIRFFKFLLTPSQGDFQMLTYIFSQRLMREGAVKNRGNIADVLYGWPPDDEKSLNQDILRRLLPLFFAIF